MLKKFYGTNSVIFEDLPVPGKKKLKCYAQNYEYFEEMKIFRINLKIVRQH